MTGIYTPSSNDGSWNNGTAITLGRVQRNREAIVDAKAR